MKNHSVHRQLSGLLFPLLFVIGTDPAHSQAQPNQPSPESNVAMDKDRIIADLLRRVEALERKLANTTGASPDAAAAATPRQSAVPAAGSVTSAPPAVSSAPSPASRSAGSAADEPAGEETSRALERTLIREGGLVLPAKSIEVDPRLTYEHRSSNALQIVSIGGQAQISREDLKRDTTEASLGLRAGLPWATQLEITLPYSQNRERRVVTGGLDQTDYASGFGSVEIGLTKQVLNEGKGRPGILGSLRWRAAGPSEDFNNPVAVASSFRTLQGAVTLIKRRDPMVFFGSVSHAVNSSRTISGSAIDPGTSTGLKLGSIFAVSPDTSMRFSFEFNRSTEVSINGTNVPGSSTMVGLFSTGFSFALTPRMLLGVEAGFGLTPSSPDFRLGLSLPIRF